MVEDDVVVICRSAIVSEDVVENKLALLMWYSYLVLELISAISSEMSGACEK